MSITSLTVKDVNNLTSDGFIKLFGNVVEHYPQAAIGILKNRPFNSGDEICKAINGYIDNLSLNGKLPLQTLCYWGLITDVSEKEKILQQHPDLAGKLADLGKLTVESTAEQISAGLDKLSRQDKQKLNELNER